MTFRIAVVQPIANPIEDDEKNVADAVNFITRAAAEGADFVCFPETYPGPWRMPATFDPTPLLAEAAAKHGINAIYGTLEPLSHNEGTAHNLIWSRAIENLAIVVTTQNLFSHAERGLAMVAAPEEILFESTAAGLFMVDVSLERAREMRTSTDSVTSSANFGAKQGVLGPQWQRPELRATMYPRPGEAAE